MILYIMHKNIKTCKIDIEKWKIIEVLNYEHLPPILKGNREKLKEWFNARMLASIKIKDSGKQYKRNKLILKTRAMNLSDSYWVGNGKEKWKDINLFDNNYQDVLLEIDKGKEQAVVEPIDKINGWKPKGWCIYKDKRYLFKRSYEERDGYTDNDREIILYNIMRELKIDVCRYKRLKDYVICKTESNSKDKELITMKDYYIQETGKEDCLLEKIYKMLDESIIEKINDMIIIDYIVNQKDRHYRNFGLLRDSNTLEIKDLYPIYDNGGCFIKKDKPMYSRIIHKSEKQTKKYLRKSKKLNKHNVIKALKKYISNKEVLKRCINKTKEIFSKEEKKK